MLSNAYFLAKFRFDTAETEPAKKLQKFAKNANFATFANFAAGADLKSGGLASGLTGRQDRARGDMVAESGRL